MQLDKKAFLRSLKARSGLHLAATAERLKGVFAEMEANCSADGDRAMAQRIMEARSNPQLQAELAEFRITTVNNFLLGATNAGTFFENVNLAPADLAYVQNQTRNELTVRYVGQDGGIQKTQASKGQDEVMVPLFFMATDDYEYTVVDLYTGDVRSPAQAQVDMGYDLGMQVDQNLWPIIKASIGAFRLTGPRHLRTYVPHSAVKTANLPTTNLLAPSDTGAATGWRKSCMDAILKYCAAWGTNTFSDGPINPQVVYIPSSDTMGMLDQITLTSYGNAAVTEIFESGYLVNYGGKQWILVGDSTLDPAEGRAYVRTNKPLGMFYTKTSLDKTIVTPNEKQNKESVAIRKVVGNAVPSPNVVNVMAVQYRTAR